MRGPPSDTDFTKVSCANAHCCALHSNGRISCWGYNSVGQGSGRESTGDVFIDVAGAGNGNCAVHASGAITCWGTIKGVVPTDSNYESIAGGQNQYCAIKTSGEVVCWGITSGNEPTDRDFVSVSSGLYHNCGVHESGEITCWDLGQVSNTPMYGIQADPCLGMTCTAISQCHMPGTCSAGVCTDPFSPIGTTCDDGDALTVNDVCNGNGICIGETNNPTASPSISPTLCPTPEVETFGANLIDTSDSSVKPNGRIYLDFSYSTAIVSEFNLTMDNPAYSYSKDLPHGWSEDLGMCWDSINREFTYNEMQKAVNFEVQEGDVMFTVAASYEYTEQESVTVNGNTYTWGHQNTREKDIPFKMNLPKTSSVTVSFKSNNKDISSGQFNFQSFPPTTSVPSLSPTVMPTTSPSNPPTLSPTISKPTTSPSVVPSNRPTTEQPSVMPTTDPSQSPSVQPSVSPSNRPTTEQPSVMPTTSPSTSPSHTPSLTPSTSPSKSPSKSPSVQPSVTPSVSPTTPEPTMNPSPDPTSSTPSRTPSVSPSMSPSSEQPTTSPSSEQPTTTPTVSPSVTPSSQPSLAPSSVSPSTQPSTTPSSMPSVMPTIVPSQTPSLTPSFSPSLTPSMNRPSQSPSILPSTTPTVSPTGTPSLMPTTLTPSRSPLPSSEILTTIIPYIAVETRRPGENPLIEIQYTTIIKAPWFLIDPVATGSAVNGATVFKVVRQGDCTKFKTLPPFLQMKELFCQEWNLQIEGDRHCTKDARQVNVAYTAAEPNGRQDELSMSWELDLGSSAAFECAVDLGTFEIALQIEGASGGNKNFDTPGAAFIDDWYYLRVGASSGAPVTSVSVDNLNIQSATGESLCEDCARTAPELQLGVSDWSPDNFVLSMMLDASIFDGHLTATLSFTFGVEMSPTANNNRRRLQDAEQRVEQKLTLRLEPGQGGSQSRPPTQANPFATGTPTKKPVEPVFPEISKDLSAPSVDSAQSWHLILIGVGALSFVVAAAYCFCKTSVFGTQSKDKLDTTWKNDAIMPRFSISVSKGDSSEPTVASLESAEPVE